MTFLFFNLHLACSRITTPNHRFPFFTDSLSLIKTGQYKLWCYFIIKCIGPVTSPPIYKTHPNFQSPEPQIPPQQNLPYPSKNPDIQIRTLNSILYEQLPNSIPDPVPAGYLRHGSL